MITQKGQTEVKTAWDAIATGYDEYVTPTHIWLANEGLRRANVRPGIRFLDVAAGTGALSIPAAHLGAEVLSTDISPKMLGRLKKRALAEGLTTVETRVMDGHNLELEKNAFDVTGSQFGVMLFPDLPKGLREMARVTKPGGRVFVIAFGNPAEVEFIGFFMEAMHAVVPGFTGLPMDPPPLPFQVADPEKLREEMAGAGLKNVQVETITEKLEFESGGQMWDWLLNSNPISGMLVAGLTDYQKSSVRKELDRLLSIRSDGKKFAVLTNPVNIGVGVK